MEYLSNLVIAELIKKACIETAKDAFQDASMSGLCRDGAMEVAISAIQKLNAEQVIKDYADK